MIVILANLLVNIFNIDFAKATLWAKRGITILAGLIVVIVFLFVFRSCGRRPASIDQESINKINSANEAERKKELQNVIEDNADVVRTVDNRSTVAETNVIERNRLIDEKIKQADQAISNAKAQGRDVTGPELECILTGNCS